MSALSRTLGSRAHLRSSLDVGRSTDAPSCSSEGGKVCTALSKQQSATYTRLFLTGFQRRSLSLARNWAGAPPFPLRLRELRQPIAEIITTKY